MKIGSGKLSSQLTAARCPYRKPKQLTDARESVDSPIDERSLQIDLVRPDWARLSALPIMLAEMRPPRSLVRPCVSGAVQCHPTILPMKALAAQSY